MLEMLERVRSGQRVAEISLRQLSVGSCVTTDSGDEDTSGCVDGTSKRLCAGTLVYNDLIGGRGISTIRVKAGAENLTSAAFTTNYRRSARRGTQPLNCGFTRRWRRDANRRLSWFSDGRFSRLHQGRV